jgi:hypothetical protein
MHKESPPGQDRKQSTTEHNRLDDLCLLQVYNHSLGHLSIGSLQHPLHNEADPAVQDVTNTSRKWKQRRKHEG